MDFLTVTHFLLMILAFVVFFVSIVVGLLFLFQEKRIKNHEVVPSWMSWLPALEVTDSLHYKLLTLGFVILSLGIIFGAFLSKRIFGAYFTTDPRQMAALVTWGIYALFLNVRIRAGWRGRRGIFLSLIGFLSLVFILLGIQHKGF